MALTSSDQLHKPLPVAHWVAQSGSVYAEYTQALHRVRKHLMEKRSFERVLISADGQTHSMLQPLYFCRVATTRLGSAQVDLITHRVFDLVWEPKMPRGHHVHL